MDQDNSQTKRDENPDFVELYKAKQWLQHQLIQLNAAVNEAEDESEPISDLEIVEERIKKLGKELKETECDKQIEQKLLERTQLSDILIKVLFPKKGELSEDDAYRNKVLGNVQTQSEVSSHVMKAQEELVELRSEFSSLRKERLRVMVQNRELMAQLKQRKCTTDDANKFTNDQQVEKARNAVDEELSKAKLIRGIFQGFIVGSGIHWAKDEYLKELVIQLGQPLRRVLEEDQ